MEKEILSIADASQMLSLPESEVERLLTAGELPGRRIGPHWFISRQRLLQFIADVEDPPRKPVVPPPSDTSLPERILAPGWVCKHCGIGYGPDVVECSKCGAIRNSPLLGYRLPITGAPRKFN